MARKLEIEIVGDASSFKRALGDSESSTSKFGRALGGMAKAGAFAAGAAGVGALFVTLKSGIGEFTEATKVAAQTEAVIKSTGGVAGITAKHVDALASSILKKTGVDDEAIKSSENLLLAFTGIRNEAGKGNDVFDRATKAIVDYSVRTGRDATSASRLFGRALEDPIKGLGGLSRAGIVLSQSQKDVIKGLVESGDKMGAQKFILDELEKRYQGAGEAAGKTLPGQLNILKETFNNLAGDLVAKAVPAVSTFVTFLNDKGLPILQDVFGKIGTAIGPAIDKLAEGFKTLGPIITGVLEPLGKTVQEFLVPIFVQLQDIGVRAMKAIGDIIRQNGPQIRQIFENLGEVISNLAKVVVPLLDFAFTKVLPLAIKVLIPVLQVVTEVLAGVSKVVRIVANAIEAVLIPAMGLILKVGANLATFLTKAFTTALEAVVDPIQTIASILKKIFAPAFDAVTAAAGGVRNVFEWFADKAGDIWKKLSKVLPPAVEVITAPFETLRGVLVAIVNAMKSFIDKAEEVINVAKKVGGFLGGIAGKIPGLQGGGTAEKGRAYVVGEHGRELFVPGVTGTVIPNFAEPRQAGMHMGTTSNGSASLVVNVYGNLLTSKRELEDMVRSAIYDVNRRNPGALPGVV